MAKFFYELELEADDLADALCRQLDHQQLHDLLVAIDEAVCEEEFTIKLARVLVQAIHDNEPETFDLAVFAPKTEPSNG